MGGFRRGVDAKCSLRGKVLAGRRSQGKRMPRHLYYPAPGCNRITPPDPQGSGAERPDRRSFGFGKKPEAVAGAPEGLGALLCLTGFGQERKPEYGMQVFSKERISAALPRLSGNV